MSTTESSPPSSVHRGTAVPAMHIDHLKTTTAATVLPERPAELQVPQERRLTRQFTRRDIITLAGAFCSALATTMLLFGRLTPLEGQPGFTIVFFLVFLLTYTVLVSLTEARPAVVDRVMTVMLAACAALALFALFTVIVFTLWRGRKALFRTNFYTQDMSAAGPLDPLSVGGIFHAIVGTLIIIILALLITVPLGLACAVFLNETGGKAAGTVRTVVTAMTALPSILAGLFIFATWILVLGFEKSGLAAAISVSIMMLPIIIRSADVVLRLVPGNLREASAALGAPHWRTVWHVVLPTARSGLTTAGYTASLNWDPLKSPMVSLPLAAFTFVKSGQPNLVARGFATAAFLMVLVLVLFTFARILGGRPAGRLSKRQARRAAARSRADVKRFQAAHGEIPA